MITYFSRALSHFKFLACFRKVREIAKQNAAQVRTAFRREKGREIGELRAQHERRKRERREAEVRALQGSVAASAGSVGAGHLAAQAYDEDARLRAGVQAEREHQQVAQIRGHAALGKELGARKQRGGSSFFLGHMMEPFSFMFKAIFEDSRMFQKVLEYFRRLYTVPEDFRRLHNVPEGSIIFKKVLYCSRGLLKIT